MVKYSNFIQKAKNNPKQTHTFVLFEYVHSTVHDPINKQELVPGCRTPIWVVLKDTVFNAVMKSLFIGSSLTTHWFTRRKIDYSIPNGIDQLTDTRQVVIRIDPEENEPVNEVPIADPPEIPRYNVTYTNANDLNISTGYNYYNYDVTW